MECLTISTNFNSPLVAPIDHKRKIINAKYYQGHKEKFFTLNKKNYSRKAIDNLHKKIEKLNTFLGTQYVLTLNETDQSV